MNKKVVIGGCILGGTLLACYLYHQQQKKRRLEIEKLLSEIKEAKAVEGTKPATKPIPAKAVKDMPTKAVVSEHAQENEKLPPSVSVAKVSATAVPVAVTPMAHVAELADVSNKEEEVNEDIVEVVEEVQVKPMPKASTSKLIKHSFSNEEIEAMMQAKRQQKEEQKKHVEKNVVAQKNEGITDSDAVEDKKTEKDVASIDIKTVSPPVAAKVERVKGNTVRDDVVLSKNNNAVTDAFPLRLGSKGKYVERLQVWLLRNYGLVAKVSKVFDESTLAQVKKHLKTEVVSEAVFNKYKMGNHVHQQLMVR